MPGIVGYDVIGSENDYNLGDTDHSSDLQFPSPGGVLGYLIASGDVLDSIAIYMFRLYGPTTDTTIPIALYDLANVATTGAEKILSTFDVPWTAIQKAGGAGWISIAGLGIDLGAHVGKRIGIAHGAVADETRWRLLYDNVSGSTNLYWSGTTAGILPDTFPATGDTYSQQVSLYAEIISGGTDAEIDASLESLVLSPFVANVSSNRLIAGGLENISLQSIAASVSSNRNISGATEAIALSVLQASVSSSRNILAALESISLQGLPANLSLGLAANTEQITLSTLLATISSNRSIVGQVESLLLSTNPAAMSVGSSIGAGIEQIALQANAAQVLLDINLSAQLESILLTSLAAQIALGQEINTGVASLVITPLGATLTLSTGITAQLEMLKLSTFIATLTSPTSPITAPGLEYTISGDQMHYTLPLSKLHFTFRS